MHRLTMIILFALLIAGGTRQSWADTPPSGLDIPNLSQLAPGILTGGEPTRADLENLKKAGYTTIINLQGLDEGSINEPAVADELGLTYITLPTTRADLTLENALRLDAALKLASTPVFVHCASGNRAGAMLALRGYFAQKMSPAAAIAHGKKAGMTSLLSDVSAIIDDAEKAKTQ
ncbi:fused DSP-PTPase phosphatase/NAD kinase-like protein [Kordiimonas sp.]|uniref:fused DSP-PTPase phosphatase/NAD kinase-like protein n=1 Tax=Kordiimonas sp. TaxID=1970157 RepID=UPI003A8DB1CC